MQVWINISLHPIRDKDVLDILNKQENKSAYVRDAVRFYNSQPTSADVLEAVRDVEVELRRLRIAGVKAGNGVGERDIVDNSSGEPAQAAANLDGLMDRLAAGILDNPFPENAGEP